MMMMFIDGEAHTGDEIPENVTAVFELDGGTQLHVQLTHEGLIVDRAERCVVVGTAAMDVEQLESLTRTP